MSSIAIPEIAYSAVMPMACLFVGCLLALSLRAVIGEKLTNNLVLTVLIVAHGASAVMIGILWNEARDRGPYPAVSNALVVDGFGLFIAMTCVIGSVGVLVMLANYVKREDLSFVELSVLMTASTAGALIMAMSNDLIVLFLGLEILSIALYALAGSHRRRMASGESAIKYFILGSIASALFLYGVAITYGATGETNLASISRFLGSNTIEDFGLLYAGMALMFIGFSFKVAAVPFHMWAPDVYQGSPTPITAYMSALTKAAAFAAFVRVFSSTLSTLQSSWRPLVYVLAVATLLVGAIVAIMQRDVKRMLAYSSISHAGFMLLGLQAHNSRGTSGILVYLFSYAFMVIGSFCVVMIVGKAGDHDHDLSAYKGLARKRPFLAFAFTIFLLAQVGVPGTSGFIAKLGVVGAAAEAKSYPLALIAMVAATIAAYFYLRLVLTMYSSSADQPRVGSHDVATYDEILDLETRKSGRVEFQLPRPTMAVLVSCLAITIVVGFAPALVWNFADAAMLAGF